MKSEQHIVRVVALELISKFEKKKNKLARR